MAYMAIRMGRRWANSRIDNIYFFYVAAIDDSAERKP